MMHKTRLKNLLADAAVQLVNSVNGQPDGYSAMESCTHNEKEPPSNVRYVFCCRSGWAFGAFERPFRYRESIDSSFLIKWRFHLAHGAFACNSDLN